MCDVIKINSFKYIYIEMGPMMKGGKHEKFYIY